jgi:transcriptional antiterminator NusG
MVRKVMRERNYYPGYVMIEVAEGKLSDDLRDIIKIQPASFISWER